MLKIIFPLLALLPLMKSPKINSWTLVPQSLFTVFTLSLFFMYSPMSFSFSSPFFISDSLSAPLIILTIWISALMILASFKIKTPLPNDSLIVLTMLILTIILVITFSSNNFIIFYIMFEASLIPILLLILCWGYQPERLQASMYLMIYTVLASLPLFANLLFISFKANSSSFILHLNFSIPMPIYMSMWVLIILAFLVKIPLFFLHLWLPKAHVEAPVAGSMVLAAILLKLGGYGLMRLMLLFPTPNHHSSSAITSIALLGATITSLICIRQPDMKSLIAYSSVAHMGLMTAGLTIQNSWSWAGALMMMIAHGLSSSGLFALANISYESTKTRSMILSKGLLTIAPSLSFLWFLLAAANMAGPPSINLISEIFLITSIIPYSLILLMLLAPPTFLAAAYSLHLYTAPNHGPPSSMSNPISLPSSRNMLCLLLHIIPLILLTSSPDLFMFLH